MQLWWIFALLTGLLLPFISVVEIAPPFWLAAVGAGSACVLWRMRWPQLASAACGLSLLLLGAAVSGGALVSAIERINACSSIDNSTETEAVFLGLGRQSGDRWRMLARTPHGDIEVSAPRGSLPAAGEQVRLRLQMNTASAGHLPWLLRSGLCGRGRLLLASRSGENRGIQMAAHSALGRLRRHLAEQLQQSLGARPAAAALAAVVLGSTERVSAEQWRQLKRTGTVHLLVISGLHLSLVAWIGGLLALGLARTTTQSLLLLPARDWRWFGSLLIAASYAVLAGYGISAQRALTMLVLAAIVFIRRRRPPPAVRALATALAAILLLDPLAALAPGLWLSFAGVAALWCYARATPQQGRGWLEVLRHFVLAQFAIACGLQVPLLLSGNSLSPVSVPANLLAVPLIGLLAVPLGLAGTALLAIPVLQPVTELLWTLAAASMGLALHWIDTLARIADSLGTAETTAHAAQLAAALASCVFLAPRGFPARHLWPLLLFASLLMRPSASPWLEMDGSVSSLSGQIRAGDLQLQFRSDWRGLRLAFGADWGCPMLRYRAEGLRIDSLAAGTGGCALRIDSRGQRGLLTGAAGSQADHLLAARLLSRRLSGSVASGRANSAKDDPLWVFSPLSRDRQRQLRPHSYPLLALLRPTAVYFGGSLTAQERGDSSAWKRYSWFDTTVKQLASTGIRCSLRPPWSCRPLRRQWWYRRLKG